MPSRTCPFCGIRTHLTIQWGTYHSGTGRGQFAATCDNCNRLSVAKYAGRKSADGNGVIRDLPVVSQKVEYAHIEEWQPAMGVAPEIEDVPPEISIAAKEAHANLAVGHVMSSLMLARAVIEACAKEKGIENGNLYTKIEELQRRGVIRPHVTEAAHELRHAGNDMAHGDFGETPETDDAEAFLEIMGEVLNEVFQSPARTARLKAGRASRKAAKAQ